MEQDPRARDRKQDAVKVDATAIHRGAGRDEAEVGGVAVGGYIAIAMGRGGHQDPAEVWAAALTVIRTRDRLQGRTARHRNLNQLSSRSSSELTGKRVAIPLFDNEVAPRFCSARQMLLAEASEEGVTQREHLNVAEYCWRVRLTMLADKHVTMLVCGGFNRRYLRLAEGLGLFVSWGHVGPVEALLEQLCAGTLASPMIRCEHGSGSTQHQRRRWRGGSHSH